MKNIVIVISLLFCLGCNSALNNEKIQNSRNNVLNVKNQLHEIDLDGIFLGSLSIPIATNEYLIIGDCKSVDSIVHIFDINTFKHIRSLATFGQGPLEVATFANVWFNECNRNLYVNDGGQFKLLIFNIDSAIVNYNYTPTVRSLDPLKCPSYNCFINDSMSYGTFLAFEDPKSMNFMHTVGIWNMNTDSITMLKYIHPDLDLKRLSVAVSKDDSLYAECELRYDLISIFNFQGELLWNIYGENWGKTHTLNFLNACFTKDYLIAGYDGTIYEEHNPITKCQVFTKQGDYLATLDFGCEILRFCYDELHNRLILCLNHTFQYGYLDLDNLLMNK